jgi:hypothetical protein
VNFPTQSAWLEVCAFTKTVPVAGNLHFSNLVPFEKIVLGLGDTLFVSGCDIRAASSPLLYR